MRTAARQRLVEQTDRPLRVIAQASDSSASKASRADCQLVQLPTMASIGCRQRLISTFAAIMPPVVSSPLITSRAPAPKHQGLLAVADELAQGLHAPLYLL
jgi:hypothetical protein